MVAAASMKRAALAYAERGYPVFPVRGKLPAFPRCREAGRAELHGEALRQHAASCPNTGHGLYDATTDVTRISEWWDALPHAGVAMPTGRASGVLVLDVDVQHGGNESLADLLAAYGELPETPVVQTGGGGYHYWLQMPDAEVRNSAGKLGPGLDIRGEGGYVVVPRSPHESGTQYEWLADSHINDVALAPAPEWLLALLTMPADIPVSIDPAGDATRFAEGSRNDSLMRLGASMRARGMDRDVIEAALLAANAKHCQPPLPDAEVRDIARSVSRYAPGSPLPALQLPDGSILGAGGEYVPAPQPEPGTPEAEEALHRDVARELHALRVRDEARKLFQKERRAGVEPPHPFRLSDPFVDEPIQYRIADLQPVNARVLLSAQFKAGKTSKVGNLTRSLADGVPFLDAFEVEAVTGTVVIIDTEMSERQLQTWLRDQGIQNTERVVVFPMRGRVSALDIMTEETRQEWVQRLREVEAEYLILDCLRPILDAFGLDENHDAGRFLVAFDALLEEADIRDALVVHHMGHAGERARGDSRLRDWPDVEWRLVRQDEAPDSSRYFTAYGRDVDVPESALTFDPMTRHLSLVGGSRKDSKVYEALAAVLDLLTESGAAMSANAIETALTSETVGRQNVRDALDLGTAQGRIRKDKRSGRGGGYEYSIDPFIDNLAEVRRSSPAKYETSPPPYRGGEVETKNFDGTSPTAKSEETDPLCSWCNKAPRSRLSERGYCHDCDMDADLNG